MRGAGGWFKAGTDVRRTALFRSSHGLAGTPEHVAWCGMISRCENPRNLKFKNYGGRGIVLCRRWRGSFAAFLRDVGVRPSAKHSLDRIDVNGNYDPGNVRWALAVQQQRNRRNSRILTHEGVTLHLSEWADRLGFKFSTLARRLQRGWSIAATLGLPKGTRP